MPNIALLLCLKSWWCEIYFLYDINNEVVSNFVTNFCKTEETESCFSIKPYLEINMKQKGVILTLVYQDIINIIQ